MFGVFVAGTVLALIAWFTLPPAWIAAVLLGGAAILTALALIMPAARNALLNLAGGAVVGLIAGGIWMLHHPALPTALAGQTILLEGRIVSLPVTTPAPNQPAFTRFMFEIKRVDSALAGAQALIHQQVRITWRQAPGLQPGEQWQLPVRLYPVHAMLNPGGFDYEAWALSQGWRIRGVVVKGPAHLLTSCWYCQRLRQAFAQRVAQAWQQSPYAGFYDALTFGERSRVTQDQWQVLQQTGTTHLMAISGLHIGLAAGLGALLFAGLWRLLPVVQPLARPQWMAIGAVILAAVYVLLSGAGLPAQRAFIMVVVAAVLVMLRRPFLTWPALALAALIIVLWQPASVLSPSFWLSFVAVAVIMLTLQQPFVKARPAWQQGLIVQMVLLVALWPLTAFFFDQAAGWRGLINLLAVPLVSLLYLPLLAVASLLGGLAPELLQGVVPWLDRVWQPFWQLLVWLAQQPVGLHLPPPPVWLLALLALALVALAWRRIGLASGLALLFTALWLVWPLILPRPPLNSVWVTVLDVGQGQAVVLETRHHVAVYDLGPHWGRLDTGAAVVVPFLHYRGRFEVDRLIASHNDIDHAGGLAAILRAFPQAVVYSGQPQRFKGAYPCQPGTAWQWDGVKFRFLWPPAGLQHRQDNAHSCVLQVSVGDTRLLLTGDLPVAQERALVKRYGHALHSMWMLAGHHGSAHSNSRALLAVVRPQQVAVSAGYGNYYHLPAAAAKSRWLQIGASVHCTGCEGALQYRVNAAGVELVRRERWARHTIFRHFCRKDRP